MPFNTTKNCRSISSFNAAAQTKSRLFNAENQICRISGVLLNFFTFHNYYGHKRRIEVILAAKVDVLYIQLLQLSLCA